MKNLSKKVVLMVVSIMLTVIALGSSIFAWFTLSTTNTVGNFEMSVSSNTGLEISLDGIEWFTELTAEQMKEAVGEQLKFESFTSTDGNTFKKMGANPTDLIDAHTTDANTKYISLQIWFRASNTLSTDEYGVFLDAPTVTDDPVSPSYENGGNGTWVKSKGITWTPDVDFDNELDTPAEAGTYYASEATRISFVDLKAKDEFAEGTSGALALDTANPSTTGKIFDFSTAPGRGYGYSYGQIKYYNAKTDSDFGVPNEDEQPVVTTFSTFDTNGQATTSDSEIVRMTSLSEERWSGSVPESVACVRVNIWLEGWDADCFDAIFKDNIKIQLSFRLSKLTDTYLNPPATEEDNQG